MSTPALLIALFDKLPAVHTDWSQADRDAWFRAAEAIFDVVYRREAPSGNDREVAAQINKRDQ